MKVLVVIVNYRTPGLTVDCLKSLAPEIARVGDVQVVVTDNKSPDDSVAVIGDAIKSLGYGSWCRLIPLEKNGGFAYGNNEALKQYGCSRDACVAHSTEELATQASQLPKPEYIWLLNPDTIVLDGALTELVRFMDENPTVGIAGGRAVNRDMTVRNSAFRFHSPLGEIEGALRFAPVSKALKNYIVAPGVPETPEKVDWVSGASMMIRREVFEKVGLLDDGYFMYYEETDFCLRAARGDFSCWYVPQSRIVHLVGQSSGVTGAKRGAKRRPKYWFQSRARYFKNNHGPLTMHTANVSWLIAYPAGRLWQLLRGKRRDDPPQLWWDFLRYNYLPCNR